MDKRFVSKFDPDDADSLSAFWDAVARRVPDPSTSGLDPDTVALVRRVQRASRIEVPAGGRDQALLAAMRELGGQRDRSNGHERRSEVTTKIISLFPAVGPENSRIESRYGHPTTNSNPGVRRRRLAAAIPLAAVAVLLLALAGNWVPTRLGLFGTNDDGQYSIPAVQLGTNATPSADVPFRNIIIPATYLPAGDTQIRSWEFNLAPGSTEYITIISWVVNVETVSTGSYGVTSEGPRLIWRAGADAPPEEIPAGEEGIVGPGDSIAYLDNAAQSVRVIGDDEVSALVVAFYSEDGNTEALGAAGDATVAVRQVRLETGESVSWPGETHVERLVESGVLTFEVVRTGESTPQGSLTYTENVPFTPFPPGITVVLRNDGDEPLVFLEAVITLSGEDGTPVSATPAN